MEKQTILVYLETAEDQVIKVSLEALNAARQLAAKTGKNVTAVLIGSAAAAGAAAAYGADEVVHVAADSYQADRYTEILTTLYQRAEASALLLAGERGCRCRCSGYGPLRNLRQARGGCRPYGAGDGRDRGRQRLEGRH